MPARRPGGLNSLQGYWPETLHRELGRGPGVLVTVLRVRGSAPREVGARMWVTASGQVGSIGGGRLEFEATQGARQMLEPGSGQRQAQQHYGLGPALNQCCGGAVTLLFEVCDDPDANWLATLQSADARCGDCVLVTAIDRDPVSREIVTGDQQGNLPAPVAQRARQMCTDEAALPELVAAGDESFLLERLQEQALPLALFGAGHVATAFVALARPLPFRIQWIDSREQVFPHWAEQTAEVIECPDPVARVTRLAPGTACLVMTHSHELDENVCAAILNRRDFAWLGLIGSVSKRRRFVHRLARRGIPGDQLERLVCPVGAAGIRGKRPATIALSIAAQLLQDVVPAGWR